MWDLNHKHSTVVFKFKELTHALNFILLSLTSTWFMRGIQNLQAMQT